MSALIIFFYQIMKVWLVKLTRLCKATGLSYKVTKLYKVARLLYKVTKSYNAINNKSFNTKSWWPCIGKILFILKF